jgi:hypothetical protein
VKLFLPKEGVQSQHSIKYRKIYGVFVCKHLNTTEFIRTTTPPNCKSSRVTEYYEGTCCVDCSVIIDEYKML